jgi:hypothetical protein
LPLDFTLTHHRLGYIAIGYFIHLVRQTPEGKNELRSRFWFGDIHQDEEGFKFLAARFINSFGNTTFMRSLRMGTSFAKHVYTNFYEEMHCLKSFLPHFYAAQLVKYKTVI